MDTRGTASGSGAGAVPGRPADARPAASSGAGLSRTGEIPAGVDRAPRPGGSASPTRGTTTVAATSGAASRPSPPPHPSGTHSRATATAPVARGPQVRLEGDRTGSGAAPAKPAAGRAPGPRRARLLLTRLDPWSVMKTFFVLSLAVAIVLVVATGLLWWTLDVTGVFAAVDRTVNDVVGTGTTPFDFTLVVGFNRVMGAALVLAAVEIVLTSAMATLFAFLYNLTVSFTHGLEVTLTEDN